MNKAELMRKLVGRSEVANAYQKIHSDMMSEIINRQTTTDQTEIKVYLDFKLNPDNQDLLFNILSREGFGIVRTDTYVCHKPSQMATSITVGFDTTQKDD